MLYFDNPIRKPAVLPPRDEPRRQDERLSRANPVGQGQPVFEPDRRLSFEAGG
jgi:hypothetical protein